MSQLICFQCPYLSDLALSPADSAQKCFFLVPKHDWSHPSLVWDCTHIYRNETRWIRRCWLYEDEGGFSHECWKKKKKTPPRCKEAHPDNRTKLQLVWARLCLVGNLSSTPRPAPPPPPLQVWNPNITWLAVCGCESISLLCCVNALITVSGVKLEKEEKKRRKKKGACRLLARTPDFIFHIKTRWKGGLNFFSNRDAFSTESCEKDVVRKKTKCLIYTCHVAPVWFCVCVWSEHLRVHFYGLLLFSGESSRSVCIYNHTVFSM